MQVVQMPPGFVSSELKLKVLLANNNIPEAFHHARVYMDGEGRPLLERFFRHCILEGKFSVLATLCLRDNEEQLIYRQLRQCKTRTTDSIQLILLLKRCKYIEAVSFMDEVAAERDHSANDETSGILSAYRTTMAPVTQSIAGTYFRIRDKLNGDQLRNASPEPFSCQLAKQSANGQLGNIFQSSALSAHWATRYANEQQTIRLDSRNMPFLRNAAQSALEVPQLRRHVRPTQFQCAEKRLYPSCSRDTITQRPKRRRLLTEDAAICNFSDSQQDVQELEQEQQQQQETPVNLHELRFVNDLLNPPGYLLSNPGVEPATVTSHEQRPTILKRCLTRRQSLQRPSFSFMPPIPLDPSMQDVEMVDMNEAEQMGLELDGDEIFVEIEQQPASPRPEAEQEQQPHNSSDADSEYMSPLASANASFVSFIETKQEQQQQEEQQPPQRPLIMAPPAGPQPRSSLSSGFGSFATLRMGSTVGSFLPPVCSSKMFESTSRVISSISSSHQVKISERTTICGDMDEPSSSTTAWSMPSTLGQPTQNAAATQPQMLDTTLGMSSYDMTALEHIPEQATETISQTGVGAESTQPSASPLAYIDLDEVEAEDVGAEEEEELEVGLEELGESQPHESKVADQEDVANVETEQEHCSSSSNEQAATSLTYNRGSPSYSVSSELSDLSSPRTDAPVYSIVVESTNSISDSRSPTSHTPNSFLPSDTNVSQNSSPRAAHGVAGEGGSNRSLYRANSLETVDDLDTTKGSLEEDDDVDEEDECVIALDGTEVRGYVARPEPLAACSSAELFAFKQQDETELQANKAPCSSLVNSDSVMAYTINLDSVDSVELQPATVEVASIAGSSSESVATVAYSEHKAQQEMELQIKEKTAVTPKTEEPAQSPTISTVSVAINLDSDVDSNPSLLLLSDKEEMDVDMEEDCKINVDTVAEKQDPMEEPMTLDFDKEIAAEEEKGRLDISLPTQVEVPKQVTVRGKRSSLSRTPPVPERSIRLRSDDNPRSLSSNRSTPSPSLTGPQLRLRSTSSYGALADDQATDAESSRGATDSPVQSKNNSISKRRVLRGSSLPPISTVPVSTPKRRRKQLAHPLEVIEETGEGSSSTPRTRSRAQLELLAATNQSKAVSEQNEDSGTPQRKLRSNSEPPILMTVLTPTRDRRRRKPSGTDQDQPTQDVTPRQLRSRRNTSELDAEQAAAPSPQGKC